MSSSQAIEKEAVRKACLKRRDRLSRQEVDLFSNRICEFALAYLQQKYNIRQTQISAYLPIRSEADLAQLLPQLHEEGAQISLPIVLDKTTIIFREYKPGDPLKMAGFGTQGPDENSATVDPTILLMPLAGFDRFGARIGYGAGHYDRALQRLLKKGIQPITIGIAFGVQEVAAVPSEPHDVPLSAVITETGVLEIKDLKS